MAMNFGNLSGLGEELNQLTERIIGCCYTVSNTLGAGFLEKVYENALAHELQKGGLSVAQQEPIVVYYDGLVIGEYVADLLVENIVLVELKTLRALDEIHAAQCINYLKASKLSVCLLVNFAHPKIEVRRFINTGKK